MNNHKSSTTKQGLRRECTTSHFSIYPSVRVVAKIKQNVSTAIHIQTCSEKVERKTIALAKATSLQSFIKILIK